MNLRLTLVLLIFVISCGSPPAIRQSSYPKDCREGQPIKELLQRGDVHRDKLILESAPANVDPERWPEVRKIIATLARTCYQLAIDQKPDHAYALLNTGFTHMVESTYPDLDVKGRDKALITATNYVQKALKAQPLDAQAYYYSGEIEARRGRCDKALEIFNLLLASRWNYSHVYTWMGYCLETTGKRDEAQAAYQKAVDISNPISISEWARSKVK